MSGRGFKSHRRHADNMIQPPRGIVWKLLIYLINRLMNLVELVGGTVVRNMGPTGYFLTIEAR